MKRQYLDSGLLLLMVLVISAVWTRYQAYRLHCEVLEKAKLCRENVKVIGLAAMMYATDYAGKFPAEIARMPLDYLPKEPLCPFDDSRYAGIPTVMTQENIGQFPSGLVEHAPGDRGYIVRCTSKLHTRYEPDLKPGYAGCGFDQAQSELLRRADQ